MENRKEMSDCIMEVCDEVEDLLIAKNAAYGDAAANPLRIFSNLHWESMINVRMDDKLSRIARGNGSGNEDAELDLLGYLILKRAIKKYKAE